MADNDSIKKFRNRQENGIESPDNAARRRNGKTVMYASAPQQRQAQPQIVMIPTYAGSDAKGQPIVNQVPMQLLGYDQKGQMVLAPIQIQQSPVPVAVHPVKPAPALARPKKPSQSSGVPVVNISKIGGNPNKKQTSPEFINAIAKSRSYEDETLTDTQGLKAHQGLAGSVEDALAMAGDSTAKLNKEKKARQGVPQYTEFTMPEPKKHSEKKTAEPLQKQQPGRPLTKKELKQKKKQDKIDEKFKREMAKRGLK